MKREAKYQNDQQGFAFDTGIPTCEEIAQQREFLKRKRRVNACLEQIVSQIQIAAHDGMNQIVHRIDREADSANAEIIAHEVADHMKERDRRYKTHIEASERQLTLKIGW